MEAELPEGWSKGKLGEIARFQSGFAFKSSDFSQSTENALPLVRIRDLQQQAPEIYVANDFDRRFRVQRGDILVGMDGEFNCVEWRQAEAALNQRVLKIEALNSDKRFLHYLAQPILRALEDQISGTTVKHLSTKHLKGFNVAVPPLREQQRIAEILTAVDDSIRAGECVIEQAERVKKGLMEELLTGGLGSAAIERGEVPTGWERATLSDLFEIARGGSPRPIEQYITEADDGVNWIKIGDTSSQSKYITSTNEKIKPEGVKRSRAVEPGDFLLSNSMSFGRPYITQIHGCIHDGWLVLKPKRSSLQILFMYYLLSSPATFQQFFQKAAGSAVKNLNKDLVGGVNAVLPIESEQQRIASILTGIDDQIDAERKHVEQQKRLKLGLMDDLLTGRVRTV